MKDKERGNGKAIEGVGLRMRNKYKATDDANLSMQSMIDGSYNF